MKVGIVGGGPAGLTCALELSRHNIEVEVFEAESRVGGMSKSFTLWNQIVDLGPHRFFSSDRRINDFWLSQIKDDYILVDRLTRIFYNKKFFYYPLKGFDALFKLGPVEATMCVLSYMRAQFNEKGKETSFEEWVSNRFGYRLYSIFFKSYTERLWGIPCTELDADFASQRIKGLNLYEAIKSAVFGGGGKKHKTLVDQFAYPKLGCGQVYDNMAENIKAAGGKIHLNTKIKKIITKDSVACGLETTDGKIYQFDYIVSSAPFTDMICSIDDFDKDIRDIAEKLKYRNTILVYLQIKNTDIFKDNWIYVHAKNMNMGRISNFRNWSPHMWGNEDTSIIALEYWAYDNDDLWKKSDADLIELAKMEIAETGLVKLADIQNGHVVKMHRSYPVYNRGYKERIAKLQEAADTIKNLIFIGRNGSFKYNNQDHSILMGLLAAENIYSGSNNNLWAVNTDYDYQEGARSVIEKK